MAFKAVFIAHVPDADPEKHKCVLETKLYKLFSVLVKNHAQALDACKRLVRDEGVHSIILCPGNTHRDVAEISAAVGPEVSVSIARGGQSERTRRAGGDGKRRVVLGAKRVVGAPQRPVVFFSA